MLAAELGGWRKIATLLIGVIGIAYLANIALARSVAASFPFSTSSYGYGLTTWALGFAAAEIIGVTIIAVPLHRVGDRLALMATWFHTALTCAVSLTILFRHFRGPSAQRVLA